MSSSLSMEDLLSTGASMPEVGGEEFQLVNDERAKLDFLYSRFKKHKKLLVPFLFEGLKTTLLLFDVETSTVDRDDTKLVGVLKIDDHEQRIVHYNRKLNKDDLIWLSLGAPVVSFAAFNAPFDLNRAFDDSAQELLLKRSRIIGGERVDYVILKHQGLTRFSYSMDIMRIARNLIDDKRRSLKHFSSDNEYFKKIETKDFLNLRYNTYDLLSEFELLVRCMEKADYLTPIIGDPKEILDFILRRFRFEPVETHACVLKLYESPSRWAKMLACEYARFPSFPGFYAGGRVNAYQTGRFSDFAIVDLRSCYPSFISRLSPTKLCLAGGKDIKKMVERVREKIFEVGKIEAFRFFYIDQNEPAPLLSTWVEVKVREPLKLRVEWLREKIKKQKKFLSQTLIYRNKRTEQARDEGYTVFKPSKLYNIPLYFFFINSLDALKKIMIIDAAGFSVSKDEGWAKRWETLYELRRSKPEISRSLKIAMNATYGLTVDVDQIFSNQSIGAHITSSARVVSFLVEEELGGDLLYSDSDSYFVKKHVLHKTVDLLEKITPWGGEQKFEGAQELIIFRTKRYAVRQGDKWTIRGGERFGGRERNRILSYLMQQRRKARDDIRQVSKQHATPEIPAIRRLLKSSSPGDWAHYFSHPLSLAIRRVKVSRREMAWYEFIKEITDLLDSGESGEILEDMRNNSYIRRLCSWVNIEAPKGRRTGSRFWLELFEDLRASAYDGERLRQVVKERTGVDCDAVKSMLETFEVDIRRVEEDRELLDSIDAEIVWEPTKSGMVYFASKSRKALEDLADTMPTTPPARIAFKKSELTAVCDDRTFVSWHGHVDTAFLGAQVSRASLLKLPLLDMRQRMRLIATAIGNLAPSNNRVVKVSVESLSVKADELRFEKPMLREMPKRARKKSPFAQRRFALFQQHPYRVRYHLGGDAINCRQAHEEKFIIVHNRPRWVLAQIVDIVNTFLGDLRLLEEKLNKEIQQALTELANKDIAFRMVKQFAGSFKIKITPYARYHRFDLAFDRAMDSRAIKLIMDRLQTLCEDLGVDYSRSLGFLGISGKKIGRQQSRSHYFMPANVVIYDRRRRFDLRENQFFRKYRHLVETWPRENCARFEIQTFANRSNNRMANPFASLLNAFEILKLLQPKIFDYLLAVLIKMCQDPPVNGSGCAGLVSPTPNSTPIVSNPLLDMCGLDKPPPNTFSFGFDFPLAWTDAVAEGIELELDSCSSTSFEEKMGGHDGPEPMAATKKREEK